MATLQFSSIVCSSSAYPSIDKKTDLYASNVSYVSIPKLLVNGGNGLQTLRTTSAHTEMKPKIGSNKPKNDEEISNSMVLQELYAIKEIVADRVEMHKNIGTQRDNWNRLLLNSVNAMTVAAATMAGLAAVGGVRGALPALKLSSGLLYVAATGILMVMNKIQPSQLAEEQRNASRLFKQLHNEIKTTIAIREPKPVHVKEAMEKVLALDNAYPLPLLGAMLDKFPASVKPAVWWPKVKSQEERAVVKEKKNGWNVNLEEEMREIAGVLKMKDSAEYARLSKLVLRVHKILAISGPLFTGVAAIASPFVGLPSWGSIAALFGVTCGALATVTNTLEHGGQVGMIFEMYRGSAGFFRLMEETIESTLKETEVDKRENGEIFEVKVALELGRSLSELKNLAKASHLPSPQSESKVEFASKLF